MKHSNREELEDSERFGGGTHVSEAVEDIDDDDVPGNRTTRIVPCCFAVLVLLAGCIGLGYYVFSQVKDPLIGQWNEHRDTIQKAPGLLQEFKNDVMGGVKQGGELYDDVQEGKAKVEAVKDAVTDLTNGSGTN
jgi:hypothetical protein